jgi:hypothetical protein
MPAADGLCSAGLQGDGGQFEQFRRADAAGVGVVDGVVHNGAGGGVGRESERDDDFAADRHGGRRNGQVRGRDVGVVVVAERGRAVAEVVVDPTR